MDATHAERTSDRPLARATRRDVLTLLRQARRPLAVAEAARWLRVHPNTARLHLESLVEAGLAGRRTQHREGRGRPRLVYEAGPGPRPAATPEAPADGGRGSRLLAQILTAHLESTAQRPIEEAAAAGRAWGRLLAEQRGPADRAPTPSVGEATEELVDLLGDLGFEPGSVVPGETVEVRHCPFGQEAGRHSPVVCAVHLGLMQGALAGRGAPFRAAAVEPFVTSGTCLARLGPAPAPQSP